MNGDTVLLLTVVVEPAGANRVLVFLQTQDDVKVESVAPIGLTGDILIVFSVTVESEDAGFAALSFFEEQFEGEGLKKYVVDF